MTGKKVKKKNTSITSKKGCVEQKEKGLKSGKNNVNDNVKCDGCTQVEIE